MPTSTMPTVKAFTRGPWKEDLHPRDRNGRFIEVGTWMRDLRDPVDELDVEPPMIETADPSVLTAADLPLHWAPPTTPSGAPH